MPGPLTSIDLQAPKAGHYLIAVYYRNAHAEQDVTIQANGSMAGSFRLTNTGLHAERMLMFSADLRQGRNSLTLRFTRWTPLAHDPQPIAVLITKITWIGGSQINDQRSS